MNYFIEGNAHPGSLVGGVLCIFTAIFLTFLSRQQASEPAPPGSPKLQAAVGVMSFNNLADAMKVTTGVESLGSRGEKGALSADGRQHSGYTAVAVNGSDEGSSAQDDAANVLLGLVLSAAAGCIDGCWSSLTLTAKLNGVDNYGKFEQNLKTTLEAYQPCPNDRRRRYRPSVERKGDLYR